MQPVPSEPRSLGILLLSGEHARAHYAFILASGAAALGRAVTVFASNAGCHALLADWSGLTGLERDEVVTARGVAGFETLRAAAAELDVRLIVCEAGLRAEALEGATLFPGVEIAGVATFLATVGDGQLVAL